MNRRGFLKLFGGMVGGIALEAAIPFGRVYSFPQEIKPLNLAPLATIYYDRKALDVLKYNFRFKEMAGRKSLPVATGIPAWMFQSVKQGFEMNHPEVRVELTD